MKRDSDKLLYGYHPLREALLARRRKVETIFMTEGKKSAGRAREVLALAAQSGAAVQWATTRQITTMVGHAHHQDMAAKVSAYPVSSLEEIGAVTPSGAAAPWVLILDQVVDPQNFGAVVRTALCAGVSGVVAPKDHSAPPSPAASKASAGALEHVRVAYVTNLVKSIQFLKNRGFWLAAADRDGRQNLFAADLTGRLAIVVGSEEKGVRPLVKRHCDFTIRIPQSGPVGSLNASAAAAVIIYEAFRQRSGAAGGIHNGR